ncbi:hypothetical protein [Cohnella hashimotonis]|uniref:Uncharacterized protein n=1 Tax=Cohnella hashimotonis TaxID=2826895 RepID=A0ABT6TFR1_9BACL|nr:hypothetical protein [Cohnella hashimotonis]MDI4645679.1 hypothetical protein [Cohnella hashimotonis]
MRKARMYPFERNRYFYGKLLTVRDFESEQKYLNDKRRLLNRLLFGSGVVAGMQVVAVDDKTVTVEMGLAIDYSGREVVIPSPVTLKLSMIEGFTNNEYKKNVYLYVAYDEKGREPVHSVGNSSIRGEEVSEYNRVLESYRLFVKEEAPAPTSFEQVRLLEDVAVLYQDAHVRISQRMPKYVNPGDVVDVTLVVEKTLQTARVAVGFDYESDGFDPVGGNGAHVEFIEPGDGQDTEYRLTYSVKAKDRPDTVARLALPPQSVTLTIGDQRVPIDHAAVHRVDIISQPVMERILKTWYERSLDQAAEGSADQDLCLAKIGLLQLGSTYMIEQVERVPFGEYVPNASLLQRLSHKDRAGSLHRFFAESEAYDLEYDARPKLDVHYHPERNMFDFKLGVPRPQAIQDEISTGTIEVPLELNAKTGLKFFSRGRRNYVTDEIKHGLGTGQVTVLVGLAPQESLKASIYYGVQDVFKGTEYESDVPNVDFGTIVYPEHGSFRIGMRLNGSAEADKLNVRWWAFKKLQEGADANGGGEAAAERAALREAAPGRE